MSVALVALVAMMLVCVVPLGTPRAEAVEGSAFNPGNIISDATFFNASSMSSGDIQAFLNAKVPTCRSTGWSCLKDFRMTTGTKPATEFCSRYDGAFNESAADIIRKVGIACGINPQVLLVLLQKERGLVTKTAPTEGDYQISMGYACPDTAPCDEEYYGFQNQVYSAASQFQRYTKTSYRWHFQPGRINRIQYSPNATCGAADVYIENQATANLYIYTPYQPNAAALNNLYGLGDGCSAYGNRNFWVFFSDWFGTPTSLQSGSFENGSSMGWFAGNGFINQAVYANPSVAREGASFMAINTPVAGRSLAQDVQMRVGIGEAATFRVALRAGDRPVSGTIAVWGLDGEQESAARDFNVSTSWQDLSVSLYPEKSAHSRLRVEIYVKSVGRDLFIDAANLDVTEAPAKQNLLRTPSFEGSATGWGTGNGVLDQQVYNEPWNAAEGGWFVAVSTRSSGSFAQEIPLYRESNDTFTFRISVRSKQAFRGTVALWGLGDSTPVSASQTFTAGDNWEDIEVSLPGSAQPISALKAEIYLQTPGASLWLDNAVVGTERLKNGSFEAGGFGEWKRGSMFVNESVYASSPGSLAHHGRYFGATNFFGDMANGGTSVYQDVALSMRAGGSYTARLWVRAADGEPYEGTLALWAIGGQQENAATHFTATGEWRPIEVRLPIHNEGHTHLRLEMYQHSRLITVFMDAAQLY